MNVAPGDLASCDLASCDLAPCDVVPCDLAPCDLAIVGGGLAGGLLALALRAARPELAVSVVEAGPVLGGDHIWSFFDTDLDPAGHALVAPLVGWRWAGYDVRFPDFARTLATPYNSCPSERLDAAVRASLPAERIVTDAVATIEPGGVRLGDGRRLAATAVIDARGAGDLSRLDCGWQKFVGQALTLAAPHGLTRPVVMDATVDQRDGYRFVYLLPFDAHTVFVEDTYYSDSPALDAPAIEARIAAYAAARGWQVAAAGRRETGVLPVIAGGDFAAYWGEAGAKAGMRAALCQPTTGYSLPDAVRLALAVAAAPDLSQAALDRLTRDYAHAAWRARGFYRLLDRMLFRAAEPAERWRVLARFYRLDPGLIARFYAGRSTFADKARILMGRPPVPIGRAVRALAA